MTSYPLLPLYHVRAVFIVEKRCILELQVERWIHRNVSATIARSTIATIEQAEAAEFRVKARYRTPDKPHFKDFRLPCVAPISDAIGVDLWMDGVHLRGVNTGSVPRLLVQAELDREVGYLICFRPPRMQHCCIRESGCRYNRRYAANQACAC